MSRKRSVSSILDDLDDEESPSNQPSSTRRNRSISGIINKEIVSSARPTSNKRKLVTSRIPRFARQESEESDNSNQDDVDDEHQDVEFNFLPRQRARKYTNRPEISENPEDSSSSEYTTEEDIYSDTLSIGSESDNDPISGISEIFEDYLPPSYEPFQNPPYSESNYN
ncbi:hypothetical protein RIR_jg18664.t2 [Rhizophagus irregularis DAOM 181602=DAOM 197198]|nr:hypothetical protein RIR_jg18664.t2 [Rhizophagus irregularis DAOM 181602=DAOM 197198]